MIKTPDFYMHHSHLMFDLETGGLPNTLNAPKGVVILSIGAVIFDPYAPLQPASELKQHSFYANIDPTTCEDVGLVWDEQTRLWWSQQSIEAQSALQHNQQHIVFVLNDFITFVAQHPYSITGYWANSPSFDKVILERALMTVGRRWPDSLPFYQENDVRTLKRTAWPSGDHPNMLEGTAHNALDDAIKQARLVQLAHRKLNLTIEKEAA